MTRTKTPFTDNALAYGDLEFTCNRMELDRKDCIAERDALRAANERLRAALHEEERAVDLIADDIAEFAQGERSSPTVTATVGALRNVAKTLRAALAPQAATVKA